MNSIFKNLYYYLPQHFSGLIKLSNDTKIIVIDTIQFAKCVSFDRHIRLMTLRPIWGRGLRMCPPTKQQCQNWWQGGGGISIAPSPRWSFCWILQHRWLKLSMLITTTTYSLVFLIDLNTTWQGSATVVKPMAPSSHWSFKLLNP